MIRPCVVRELARQARFTETLLSVSKTPQPTVAALAKNVKAFVQKILATTIEPQEHPMRELTSHKVNGVNDGLTITVLDEPGQGGAHHAYDISFQRRSGEISKQHIFFQNGPIGEKGVNGVTHESLLAILIDRLDAFQRGPYACEENADALASLVHAQAMLKSRTEKRLARGVEGTHTV